MDLSTSFSALLSILQAVGAWSATAFWLPSIAWTLMAAVGLSLVARIPDSELRLRAGLTDALLFAYPAAILLGLFMHIPDSWSLLGGFSELRPEGDAILRSLELRATGRPDATLLTMSATQMGLVVLGLVTCVLVCRISVRCALFVRAGLQLARLRRSEDLIPDVASQAMVQEIMPQLVTRHSVQVYRSRETQFAYSSGILRRIVVLPVDPSDVLVLWHEVLHHARGDIQKTWVLSLVNTLLGVHPLVRRLHDLAIVDLEISCDRDVVKHSGAHKQRYAKLLLDNARRAQNDNRWALALPITTTIPQIKRRIYAMTNTAPTRFGSSSIRLATLLLFATATFFAACSTAGTDESSATQASAESTLADNAYGVAVDEAVELAKISGTITDTNGTPVAGAVVTAAGSEKQFVTDENGTYWMILPSGSQDVTVTYAGVSKTTTVELSQSYTRELNVAM